MPFVPIRGMGALGLVQDLPSESIPVNAWSDSLNVRFIGGSVEKMLEPEAVVADTEGFPDTSVTGTNARFSVTWQDDFSSYMAVVFRRGDGDYIYRWDQRTQTPDASTPVQWEEIGGPYEYGPWQGFQWGDTIILNNGTTAPQIFNRGSQLMEDLPNWGKISSASDITTGADPSIDTVAKCRIIIPLGAYLVALNVQESGDNQPNKVWWSDPAAAASIEFAPLWDYTSPVTQSAQAEAGIGSGLITAAELLNDNLIIYTENDCTAMTVVGGRFIMDFRRLFNYGAAGLHCVEEFENKHFVVSRDRIYIHDGSTPVMIAEDRVEREFFKRTGTKDSIEVY